MSTRYLPSIALGAASGGRALTPIAILSLTDSTSSSSLTPRRLAFLNRPIFARLLQLSAVGELVLDKLPFIPDRTMPGSLAGRTAFGGISATIVATRTGASPKMAACIGSLSAAVSTFALFCARRALGQKGVRDVVTATIEDTSVIALSLAAIKRSCASP